MQEELQLRRLEVDHTREERERERKRERGERQQQLELKKLDLERQQQLDIKKLELELSRPSYPSAHPTDPPSSWPPPFRVEVAVKLVPKFSENDVETFLISFEKVDELNNFHPDKYAAILQARLAGKTLKVFTKLSVEKSICNLNKSYTETYSEFAFRLSTQFTRWLESEGAYSDVELLRDLIEREQFQSNLDSESRVWLIDQKPKNLPEAARLADQYVAVRKADRPIYKGHESSSKGHAIKPKSFGESGRSTTSGGFQKSTSFGHNAKPHTEQKPSATTAGFKHPA